MTKHRPPASYPAAEPVDSDSTGVDLIAAALKLLGSAAMPQARTASSLKPQDCTAEEWAALVVDAYLNRICTRFPKPRTQCPFTGLNRNQLYEITRQTPSPVRTVSMKEAGERSGARFFFVGDALRYLGALADQQAQSLDRGSSCVNKKNHGQRP